MDVDEASRQASHALLGDVLDLLTEVSEWADKEADVIDGPGGEDGADVLPNRAARVQSVLDDNSDRWDSPRGLLSRVETAWRASA